MIGSQYFHTSIEALQVNELKSLLTYIALVASHGKHRRRWYSVTHVMHGIIKPVKKYQMLSLETSFFCSFMFVQ